MDGPPVAEVVGVQTVQDLGALLRRLRRRHAREAGHPELTVREVAARTGWSVGVVADYFAGRVLAPTDRFDALVRLLGASAAEQGALATARDRVEERRRGSRAVPPPVPARQLPPPARRKPTEPHPRGVRLRRIVERP